MEILVTGAAGYIGSVVSASLVEKGHKVVGLDDLRYGHRSAVHPEAAFVQADITDRAAIDSVFEAHAFDAVVHLAAEAYIDESIFDPGRFYRVNVEGGLNILEAMRKTKVQRMIFSSTAAIFGQPKKTPIDETAEQSPVNAYGETKLAFERAMKWYRLSFGLKHISFRYFNACGATERNGEDRKKETHLIPILFQVATKKRESLSLFGTNYPTPDGTCIRDYVHVEDIASAHVLGLERIDELQEDAFNLGSGEGNSNLEVIRAAEKICGTTLNVIPSDPRPGDPAILVASSERAKSVLGWNPNYSSIDDMIETAWRWRSAHPNGYSA